MLRLGWGFDNIVNIAFLWVGGGWGGVVCKVIFMSNPTTVLRLCCVVVGVVTILLHFDVRPASEK